MDIEYNAITKLFDVMTIPIYGGTSKQIQNRYGYGLTFCATPGGRIEYEYLGQRYVSDYDNAVLLPMGQTYMLNGIHTGDFPLINFYCAKPLNNDSFATFPLSTPGYYLQTYEQIRLLCRYNQPFCYARAMSLMYELISHLLVNPGDSENPCLASAISYIDMNYADPELSMDSVAAHSGISTGYLRKIFKDKYSVSPKKYILNSRMMKAKELLVSGKYPTVFEVAQSCGFTNIYHFDRVFREYTGCSPTEYIQRFAHKL